MPEVPSSGDDGRLAHSTFTRDINSVLRVASMGPFLNNSVRPNTDLTLHIIKAGGVWATKGTGLYQMLLASANDANANGRLCSGTF